MRFSWFFFLVLLFNPCFLFGSSSHLGATEPSHTVSSTTVDSEFRKLPEAEHAKLEEQICKLFGKIQEICQESSPGSEGLIKVLFKELNTLIQSSCHYSYYVLFHALWFGDERIVNQILQRSTLKILTETEFDTSKIHVLNERSVPKNPIAVASYLRNPVSLRLLLEHFFFFYKEHSSETIRDGLRYRYSLIKDRTEREVKQAKESICVEGDIFFRSISPHMPIVTKNGKFHFQLSCIGLVLLSLKYSKITNSVKDFSDAKSIIELLSEYGQILSTHPAAYFCPTPENKRPMDLVKLARTFELFDFLEYLLTDPKNKLVTKLNQEDIIYLLSKIIERKDIKTYRKFQNLKFSHLGLSFEKVPYKSCFGLLTLCLSSGKNELLPVILKSFVFFRENGSENFQSEYSRISKKFDRLFDHFRECYGPQLFWEVISLFLEKSLLEISWTPEKFKDFTTHADEKSFERVYNSDKKLGPYILKHNKEWNESLIFNKRSRQILDFMRAYVHEERNKKRKKNRKIAKTKRAVKKQKEEEQERIRKALRIEENKRVKEFLKPLLDFLQERPDVIEEKKLRAIQSATRRKRERLLKKEGVNETQFEDRCRRISESSDCQTLKSLNHLYKNTNTSWDDVSQNKGVIRTASLRFFLGHPFFFANVPLRVHSDEELQETLEELHQSLITHYEKEAPGDFLWHLPYSKESLLIRTDLTLEGSKCVMILEAYILRDGVLKPFIERLQISLEELLKTEVSLSPRERKSQERRALENQTPTGKAQPNILEGGATKGSLPSTDYLGAEIWDQALQGMLSDQASDFFQNRNFSYKDPHTSDFLGLYFQEYEKHVSENNRLAFRTVFDYMLANPENSTFTLVNENDSSIEFRCFHKSSGIREIKSGKASIFWTYEDEVFRVIAIGTHREERSYNIEWVNEDWARDTMGSVIPSGVYSIL